MSEKISVGVIGAGPSGLAALRHLSKDLDTFIPTAFEKGDRVGGVWIYTDNTDLDEDGMCNALYKNLRTNLPKEVMDFPDMPFPSNLPSFIHHKHVREYCENYANKWDLLPFIKFRTRVVHVKPVDDTDYTKWIIDTEDLITGDLNSDQFDAVMVCNGHFSTPYLPDIPGFDLFQGHVIHSRQYRVPDVYRGQKVICVGGSFSGLDIMAEVAVVAEKVYLSHDGNHSLEMPHNTEQVPRIDTMGDTYVVLTNGRHLEVDAIIFCTGYKYDFRFLSPDCGIVVDNEHVTPLYKHLFNIIHPTMSFIGLLKRVLLFRCSHMQADAVCSVLKGQRSLPTKEGMLEDERRELRSLPSSHQPHDLFGRLEVEYYDEMRKLFGVEVWPEGVHAIYDRVVYELIGKDAHFKNINFVLSPDKKTYKELAKLDTSDNYVNESSSFEDD